MKIKMINNFLNEQLFKKMKNELENLNDNNKFAKTAEAFQKYEEKDIMSDYDDEGKYAENDKNDTTSGPDTNKNVGESGSEESQHNKSFVSFE